MPAVYPGSVRAFSSKIDLDDTVFALHINDLQDEVTSIQTELGTNAKGVAVNVRERVLSLETGKSATSHDHTNRLDAGLHDIEGRHVFGAAYGSPVLPSALTLGGAGSTGSGDNPAKEDHVHPMPAATTVADSVLPPGTIVAYGGTTAPAGWFLCDGAVKVRATYTNLFNVLGTSYNTGGEAGTDFRLPNLQNKYPMGRATPTTAVITSAGFRDATLVSHDHPGSGVGNGNADHQHYTEHTHFVNGRDTNHRHDSSHLHNLYVAANFGGTDEQGWPAGDNHQSLRTSDRPIVARSGPVPSSYVLSNYIYNGENASHDHGSTGLMQERDYTDYATGAANHGHGLTIGLEGSSATDKNLPPYQTVNYIIKL